MKVDFKRRIPGYSARRGAFSVLTVPTMQFLMIDGHGDPNTSEAYRHALSSIYPMAYALKFLSKVELDRDFTVMPLEALWWSDDMRSFTSERDKTRWDWTLLLMQPDWIGAEHVEAARERAVAKGAPRARSVRLERVDEGLSVQTLHVGSYDDEAPVLAELHGVFLPANGLRPTGKHHEIYLSDPRRTAPERLRTILRQPVDRTSDDR